MRPTFRLAAAALAAGFIVAPALAQDAGDRPQRQRDRQARPEAPAPMSPERQAAVWELQALTVSTALKADAAVAKQIAESWKAVRTDLDKQVREMAEERRAARAEGGADDQARGGRGRGAGAGGGEGAGDAGARRRGGAGNAGNAGPAAEMREKAMASLKTKLATSLSGAQLDGAMKAFGIQTAMWDRTTDAIIGMKVDDAKQMNSMLAVHTYLADLDRIRAEARESNDRQGSREAMANSRATLELSLTEALSEDEMQKLMQSMQTNQRGGRGGAGGGAGADGGPGAGRGAGRGGAGGAGGPGAGQGRGGRGGAGGGAGGNGG